MSRPPARTPVLWFERVCYRAGLSYPTGVLFIGTLPLAIDFFIGGYLRGGFSEYDLSTSRGILDFLNLVAFIPFPAVCLFGARYLTRTVAELSDYAAARWNSPSLGEGLGRLGSLKLVALTYVPLFAFTLFLLSSENVLSVASGGILLTLLDVSASIYAIFILATLVWVFGYSMYLIHRVASEPMALRSFGEDPALGLRPFGIAAFRLTLVYLGAVAVLAIHVNIPPQPPAPQLGLLSLFLVAVPLFLLPLRTVHRQLVAARTAELDWIAKKYGALFSAVRSRDSPQVDDGLKGDLAALASLRALREDVKKGPTWPFDTTAVTQLAAILLSVSGVLTSSIIRDLLHF